jgi:metal-responsive CopG/Arc/MetJ family transcriptional regulator
MCPTIEKLEKIKYTVVLPKQAVEELKTLAMQQVIPSVNQGIQKAIESFLVEKKKEQYQKLMKEASRDEAFMKRTIETQTAFEDSDNQLGETW